MARWFAPKRYGFGIRPSSAMGWISLIVFFILFAIGLHLALNLGAAIGWALVVFAIILITIIIILTYSKN